MVVTNSEMKVEGFKGVGNCCYGLEQCINLNVLYQIHIMTIKWETYTFRPELGRSCRCMKIQGHDYESVVHCVLF